MKKNIGLLLCIVLQAALYAQDKTPVRTITMAEYEKVKTLQVKDLDNDTYVKFENTYILDRYEGRKPYFVTGDDGKKKRFDLYRLLLKDGMQELGTVIYYTDEKNKTYEAFLPDFRADAKIWNRYFEDIHAIDKVEPNFVLKLSYILSKEFGFQLYKAANQGKDLAKEAGTYGSDICFPGDVEVTMWNGSKKNLSEIQKGDKIVTVDPVTQQPSVTVVKGLVTHEEKNYAITHLLLLSIDEKIGDGGMEVKLGSKELNATPNHPVMTMEGEKKIGSLSTGDEILCLNKASGKYERYVVWDKNEHAGGLQKVYNIVADGGNTFVMNDVMVLQKPLSNQ
jgi:hypothetical protein